MSWHRLVTSAFLVVGMGIPPALAQSAPDEPAPAEDDGVSGAGPVVQPPPPSTAASPPTGVDDDRPFARAIPNFFTDLKRLPSIDSAVVLGVGGLLSVVVNHNDRHFTEHASAGGTDDIFKGGGVLGDGFTQGGMAIGVYAIGRLAKRPKIAHVGADLMRAQLVTGVLTHTLKLATRRDRPTGDQESATKTYSFPSGHSAASWTSATVLWRHLGWRVGVPASTLAAFVSASRLQQNQHYMSDVLFGAALGIASARTVTIGHGGRRLMIMPTPTRGGGAVMLSLMPN